MDNKLLIICICLLLIFICSVGAAYYIGVCVGMKSRPVYIDVGKVNLKMPEILSEAGIKFTDEQIKAVYHRLNQEKEKIGFKEPQQPGGI